jgi:hypothetical protein
MLAHSSAAEHYLDTVGVHSSILCAPTSFSRRAHNTLENFCYVSLRLF